MTHAPFAKMNNSSVFKNQSINTWQICKDVKCFVGNNFWKKKVMERLETSKVRSFVSFCSRFWFSFCIFICSTKENIHDNKEIKRIIWLRRCLFLNVFWLVLPREVFRNPINSLCWSNFWEHINDFQPLTILQKKLHHRCSSGF